MANRWDTVETVADFIFLGSKITVDGDCNHESKRHRIQDAWGWCTGMTQREGMEREVGGGFRIGNTCIPVADSC